MNEPWLQFYGRLHPLLLHAPLGALLALVVLELWGRLRPKRGCDPTSRRLLALLTAATALATAGSGWFLGQEDGYTTDGFLWHRGLGIAFAVSTVLFAFAACVGLRRTYGWSLTLACGLAVVAGHFGASLTHGGDFLLEPFRPPPPAANWYEARVRPILDGRCGKCHGAEKQKGELALHEPARIAEGGEGGPVIVAGDPAASELMRRLRLPLDDDDHMPPESKPQPTEQELEALERWIEAGASFEAPLPEDLAPLAVAAAEPQPEPVVEEPPAPVFPAAAIAALRDAQVHVEVIEPATEGLWIDFLPSPDVASDWAVPQLEAAGPFVVELSLAGVAEADSLLEAAAAFPRLDTLDLSRSSGTLDGLAHLRQHASLRSLNLAAMQLDDGAVELLASLPALEQVHVWNAGLTAEGIERLARERPALLIHVGDGEPSAPLETEGPVRLTSAPTLTPVNTVCPVSGDPVDAGYSIVFGGRVIGFCCPNCPKTFWADPEQFPIAE